MQHIAPVGSRRQPCDLAAAQPCPRLRTRLVRPRAARCRRLQTAAAGWYQSDQLCMGAVKCHPASARSAALRLAVADVAARLRVHRMDCHTHRRTLNGCPSSAKARPSRVVGARGGAVCVQLWRHSAPAGACGRPLAGRCGPEVGDHDTPGIRFAGAGLKTSSRIGPKKGAPGTIQNGKIPELGVHIGRTHNAVPTVTLVPQCMEARAPLRA